MTTSKWDEMSSPRNHDTCKHCMPMSGYSVFVGDDSTVDGCATGHYTCYYHATNDDKAIASDQTRRAFARGGAASIHLRSRLKLSSDVDWPYGCVDTATRERLLTWLEHEDLYWATMPTYHECTRWVRLGYCRKMRCSEEIHRIGSWFDHSSYWKSKDGHRRVLVSQPYSTIEYVWEDIAYLHNDHRLRLEVREDAWYGRYTVFIGLWNI